MPSSKTWIDMRSGAPGLPGPYLLEYLAPYKELDLQASYQPQLILAVGGTNKRHCLSDCLNISYAQNEYNTVTLQPVIRGHFSQRHIFLADCELHQRQGLLRIKAGPMLGSYESHEIKNIAPNISRIAYRLYFNTLSPFCSAVLLFISDLGGIDAVIELLALWAKRAIIRPPWMQSRLLLVFDNEDILEEVDINGRIAARLLQEACISDPTRSYTIRDINSIMRKCYTIQVVKCLKQTQFVSLLTSKISEAVAMQDKMGMHFHARHLRYLIQAAIAHSTYQLDTPFNVYRISRINNPVSDQLANHIGNFVRSFGGTKWDCATLVASALVMDAYPPEMHCFLPAEVFDELYTAAVSEVERSENICGFSSLIRHKFVEIANNNLGTGITSSNARKKLVLLYSRHISLKTTTCAFCLARYTSFTLDCKHCICTTCTRICGVEDHWIVSLVKCPLCAANNTSKFNIRPPTAASRILSLGGLKASDTLQFLKDLQEATGLTSMSIREHFDGVIAQETGIFFTIGIFLNSWTIADCKYHLKKVKNVRILSKDRISCGKGLEWHTSDVRESNQVPVILKGKRTIISSSLGTMSGELPWLPSRTDVLVKYTGKPYHKDDLRKIADKLFASLFYLEVMRPPAFYSAPQTCSFLIRCRIAPGPALMDLLIRYNKMNMQLLYQADEFQPTQTLFSTADLMERCKICKPFKKEITVQVYSKKSVIDVKIGHPRGIKHNISNSPCTLDDLLRDQGLHSCFGRSNHSQSRTSDQPKLEKEKVSDLDKAFILLQNTLQPLLKLPRYSLD